MKIYAPVSGKLIALEDTNDLVFSTKMLGDGLGIIPNSNEIFAPLRGVVTMIFPTLHAYGFKTENDIEMLIHIGIETVNLGGDGFEALVQVGDRVDTDTLIARVDLERLAIEGVDSTVMVVCVQPRERVILPLSIKGDVTQGAVIYHIDLES